ncbi:MAG TPA: fumarylacetoacetate hydrolase family protein [Legionellaceae bacterium]|nr:fumarylacetoacetate hydrolase family protein [Legionellaceae bacterium]
MKLIRFGERGHEKPGLLDTQGNIRDISAYIKDINPDTIAAATIFKTLADMDISQLPMVNASSTRIGVCVGAVGKVICIGFNSHQHAAEVGVTRALNAEPIVFMKPSSVLAGAFDPILFTRHSKKLDWEAELGVIISKQGKYIDRATAHEYIFGYACCNDLSERYLQFETEDKQFTKGKCFDGAATLGPYLVTKSEIADAHDLQIKLWVNNQLRQDFNTRDYIYDVEHIISYLSQYFTLYPGDVISMGSAPGSAAAWGPDCFLRPGDEIRLQITGLGEQLQKVIME